MVSYRRCGIFVALVLALLALAPISSAAQAITLVKNTTRSAGTGTASYNADSGSATTVNLSNPSYIVFDSTGNQYISDTLNNCVRKIDTSGNVTTVAGLAVSGQSDTCYSGFVPAPTAAQGLYRPTGLAIDASNRLYIADSMHHCIRALASGSTGSANLVPVAGTCGTDPLASITPSPSGLALDSTGNLYISVALVNYPVGQPVSQVLRHNLNDAAQNACYLAGAASANVSTPCPGITNGIQLNSPAALAIDASNNLFIADTGNNCIREVAALTTQQTAVGQCLNDASGNAATALHAPYGLAVSATQALYISQSSPDNIVRFSTANNSLQLVAGLPSGLAGPYDSAQDGNSAINAPLDAPLGLAFSPAANLFVADSNNHIIRQLNANLFFPSTNVGSTSAVQAVTVLINQPVNLAVASATDYTIASTTCFGTLAPAAKAAQPTTCQVFLRFTPTRPGLRSAPLKLTDSVSGTSVSLGVQGTGTGALGLFTPGTSATVATHLTSPAAIATDAAGNAYVLDSANGASTLRSIPAVGGASQTILTSTIANPSALAADAAGNWYLADATHGSIARYGADGSITTSYVVGLDTPTALVVDHAGNLVIAQAGSSHNVIKVFAAGGRLTLAGSGLNTAADDVTATNASFLAPSALTQDANGTLYVADQAGHRIYAIDHTGSIHVVAGNGTTATTVAGHATGTAILTPSSLATDAAGDLYIADQAAGIVYIVYATATNDTNIASVYTVAAQPTPAAPLNIALDANSNIFISNNATQSVVEVTYPNPTLTFGTVLVGSTSAAQHQAIANTGNQSLAITGSFTPSDSHFTVDTASTTCGTSILSGAVCSLGFTFTPTANATLTASSTLVSNAYNTPQTIALNATGKQTAALAVALPAQSEIYGQSFPEVVTFSAITAVPTGTITFATEGRTLCIFTGTLTATTTCTALNSGLDVGTHTISFNYSGDTNYSATSGVVTLSVTPAPLAEIVNNASRSYGTTNPTFSGTLTGAVAGDTFLVSYATTASANSPVGTYPIAATLTPVGATSLANYTFTNTPGTLTITANAKSLVINVNSATRIYGAANPSFAGSVTGVIPGDDVVVTYNTAANNTSSTGTYPIGASISGNSASNYIATIHPGTLAITAASTITTISSSAASMVAGSNVTFTANVSATSGPASGIVNFYDGTVLLGSGTLTAGSASFTIATLGLGTHTIAATFLANTNYTTSGANLTQIISQPIGSFVLGTTTPNAYLRGGGVTTYQITISSIGAFAGQVDLTCAGLPADATCSFSNASPTVTAGGTATTTMTVTTTAADARLQAPLNLHPADFAPITAAAVFPMELSGLGVCFAGLRRRKTLGTQRARLLILLAFTLAIVGLTGCGTTSPAASRIYTINITANSVTFPASAQTTSVVLAIGQ